MTILYLWRILNLLAATIHCVAWVTKCCTIPYSFSPTRNSKPKVAKNEGSEFSKRFLKETYHAAAGVIGESEGG